MEKEKMTDREYRLDKEYNVPEIIRYNLRMWWLAILCALACAALLGGYKFRANYQFVEKEVYDSTQQATASLYVRLYSDETAVERANTLMKMAASSRTYEKLIRNTGYALEYEGYDSLFEVTQSEVSDVISVFVNFPAGFGEFAITDEKAAVDFVSGIIEALDEVSQEIIGRECITILDRPHATNIVQKTESYFITADEFRQGVLKAATAGFLLGIIVEIVLYTCWMLLYKKPKNAEEIRQCMDAPVIDTLKDGNDNAETFRKVTLSLGDSADGTETAQCRRVNCISLLSPRGDVALKVAMSYANEQKKTLFINLAGDGEQTEAEHSLSGYILGGEQQPAPLALSQYLDVVCRTVEAEKGLDLVGNSRFPAYVEEKSREYERIVIGSPDVLSCADAYVAARMCDRNFFVCGRKRVKNEMLYRVKNEADVNRIKIDGILVYE